MKKILILIVFTVIVACTTVFVSASTINNNNTIPQDTKEILYNDVIITALKPAIDEGLTNCYKNVSRYAPNYDIYMPNIIKVERPNGDRTAYFIIKIEIEPYIGPHIPVGKDQIFIELKVGKTPTLLKCKHLESYILPERYNDYYLN